MSESLCPVTASITSFVVDHFLFGEAGDLTPSDSLLDRGVLDSTGVLELIEFVESHFQLRVPAQDLIPANIDGIDRLAGYIKSKL